MVSCLAGCITNDLPYPVMVPAVVSVEADGAESVEIDNANQTITVYLQEYVDPRKLLPQNLPTLKAVQEKSR